MPTALPNPGEALRTRALQWLALLLTPGLGPTRARRIFELFGSVDHIFQASLTELEAAAIPAVSAQSLATGKSMELAGEELARPPHSASKF